MVAFSLAEFHRAEAQPGRAVAPELEQRFPGEEVSKLVELAVRTRKRRELGEEERLSRNRFEVEQSASLGRALLRVYSDVLADLAGGLHKMSEVAVAQQDETAFASLPHRVIEEIGQRSLPLTRELARVAGSTVEAVFLQDNPRLTIARDGDGIARQTFHVLGFGRNLESTKTAVVALETLQGQRASGEGEAAFG